MMIVMGWILFYSTVNLSVTAATENEVFTFIMECIGKSSNACDRVVLYLLGDCENRTYGEMAPSLCESSIKKYAIENVLQNERRLTQDEVVEDLRILDQQPPR